MRDMTFSEIERLGAAAGEADETFHMDEDAFRVFYERTARPVWAYLSRMTGDARLADDLLQETYYRFLRAAAAHDSDAHRRNYLFRIATNLVRDHRRHARADRVQMIESPDSVDGRPDDDIAAGTARRLDLARAMARLKPRERELLWLAYAHGSSHQEIADALGLKRASIKLLLFRARRRLAGLLRDPRESRQGTEHQPSRSEE
jgi:RNA polymerase sigma-70 factor (ECF subfamily)